MTLRTDMNDVFKCQVPALGGEAFEKLEIPDPDAATDIERRFNRVVQQMAQSGVNFGADGRTLTRGAIEQINADNMIQAGRVIHSSALRPDNARGLQEQLARRLGIVHEWLGVGDGYTEAGWVRESLNRIRRLWQGGIQRALREEQVYEQIAQHQAEVVSALRRSGLRQYQIDEILIRSVEEAYAPVNIATLAINSRAAATIRKKTADFIDELRTKYNLSQDVIDVVINNAVSVAEIQHKVAGIAQRAGVALNETPVWGYFHRAMSPAAERRFNWRYQDNNILEYNDGTVESIGETFMRSRSTADHIVGDEVLLDFVMRTLGRSNHDDPLFYFKLGGGSTIGDVLDSNFGLAHAAVRGLQNDAPETFEALIDSRVLSKIPWTTREVGDYIIQSLKMPFDNLNEIFAHDWTTGFRVYRDQLVHTAQEQGIVNLTYRNAVEGLWGVPAATARLDPQYADYVPLSAAFPASVTRRSTLPVDNSLFVHPTVARLVAAQYEMITSPFATHVIARIYNYFGRVFRKNALTSGGYAFRQIWQNMLSVGAAGGDLIEYMYQLPRALMQTLGEQSGRTQKRFLNFDDTRELYRTGDGRLLTEQGLYNYLNDIGLITNYEPLTGEVIKQGQGLANLRRDLRYVAQTISTGRIDRAIEELAAAFEQNLIDPVFLWTAALINSATNNAGVMTVAKSLLRREGDSPGSYVLRAARLAPLGSLPNRFNTVDEAVEHIRHYFYFYDDRTALDRQISNIVPFWTFMSKNTPAIIRYVARHPARFTAWARIYSMLNQPVMDDPFLGEGAVPDWTIDQQPIYWRVPNARSDGRDGYFVLPMYNLDPVAGGLEIPRDITDAVLEAFGIWGEHSVESTRERLGRHDWMDTGTNRLITKLEEYANPAIQSIIAELRGTDGYAELDTGETIDEWYGMRVNPRVRMWLTTVLPQLETVNRLLPESVVGRAPDYNIDTGQYTGGTRSVFGVPRSGRNRDTNNPYSGARAVGVNIHAIDVYRELGLTYDTLAIDILEGRKFLQKMKENLSMLEPGSAVYQQRLAEVRQVEYILEQSERDYRRIEEFARSQGLNPRTLYHRMQQRNTTMNEIP